MIQSSSAGVGRQLASNIMVEDISWRRSSYGVEFSETLVIIWHLVSSDRLSSDWLSIYRVDIQVNPICHGIVCY